MKKTILQVVQHLRPGGIETMALELMKQLSPDHTVHLVSLEGNYQEAVSAWPRLASVKTQLHFLNKKPGVSVVTLWHLCRLIKALGVSAIHSHHSGPLLYAGLAGKITAINTHIHTEHDVWHLMKLKNRRLHRVLLKVIKPILVADCNQVASQLHHYFPTTPVQVISNGIDMQHFVPAFGEQKLLLRRRLGLPEKSFLIGCAARLEQVKNHNMLLEVFRKLAGDSILVLAGNGSLHQSLAAKCKKMGIANKVFFLGNQDEMLPFYQALDLFCLVSHNEGLPLSPIEAQACAIPVILTDVGGCHSIVCPRTGTLIEAGNARMLEKAIVQQLQGHRDGSPRPFAMAVGDLQETVNSYRSLLT
ncbi:MAG: glycosyltransferase [Pseudomonadales bacterium]|nr:glycosyltransferase [Pseudomonadales bacterium]NRA14017.1 glycosyltransferase [Oceanospirillaceae bacterium]